MNDPLDELLAAGRAVPSWWRGKTAEAGFEAIRCRLSFTQSELSIKSGVAQSRVSHLEGGGDARLSTWRRVYAAMGFDLLLLPVSFREGRELERRAERGRPPDAWLRQRARPRAHKKRTPPEAAPAGSSDDGGR